MYLPNPSIDTIKEAVNLLDIQANESLVLLFGEETVLDYEELIKSLNTLDIHFFGAFFPGIIYGKKTIL